MDESTIHIRIPLRRFFETIGVFVASAVLFIGAQYVFATTPNPGHPWTDLGNGFWQVANTQTALRTFTFPDADETVLTTAGAPQSGTVIYGSGTGVLSTTTAGTAGFVLALLNGVPTWTATTTLSNISGTLGLTGGGTNASLTASNGGIVWSNATQLQILGGTATANKVLMSGSSATPSWSTPTFPNASATSRKIIVSDGTNWVASTETHATPGTAGQVLMSNGTNWISAATSSSGTFIKTQTLTSGTTYTPTAGTKAVLLRMCAGGGGGGGANAAGTTNGSLGAGGGSGGYLEKYVTFSTTAASYTIAIGGAGSGGSGVATGGSGGNTTFACDANCSSGAVTFTANAGSGGTSPLAGTIVISALGGAGGAVSTNGDLNSTGQPGGMAMRTSGTAGSSGNGASSPFGGGGVGKTITATAGSGGNAAGGFCAGGGGAVSNSNAAQTGGAGTTGVIVVSEFR